METIGIPVRKFFLQALLNDVLEVQDHAERLARANYQALDPQTQSELDAAYKHLFAARVQIEQQIESL